MGEGIFCECRLCVCGICVCYCVPVSMRYVEVWMWQGVGPTAMSLVVWSGMCAKDVCRIEVRR